ncbi:ribonuclease P protein component 3 [Methanobacterium spitsbergense]|nr:RNase P subunit p30 family protein [Methanobacterium spitsbergense]
MQESYSNRNLSKDMFFDLHVHGNENIIKEAERLGFTGIGVTSYFEDYNSKFLKEFEDLELNSNILLKKSVEIACKNPEDLKKKVKKSRKKADILIVKGGDLKVNRAACEDKRIDILSQPYRSRRDMGINHVLARKAAENSVAIEINLKTFLKTNLRYRYRVISQFRHIVDLQRKFKFPLIITSSASSKYDLKTPIDIFALAKCFGMTFEESFKAISITPRDIIETNNLRDYFIVEGVRTLE